MYLPRTLLTMLALSYFCLSGCATNPMRSYDAELKQTGNDVAVGNVAKALADHEKNNTGEKDLLYFLEKGSLLRLDSQIAASRDTWLKADEKVRIWEEEAKNNPEKILSYIASGIVNDKMLRYDGQDFEKVMLSTNLALNHVLLGNWDDARTEIKKMHEREAIIADIRAKELDKVEKGAKSRNVKTEMQDLKGYPVETLNDPEVTKLKNSFQSAFSHYFAGFVYEALNEPSLAAPGYRKAIELRPGIKILEDGLRNLERRSSGGRVGKGILTDVLFVVESGKAPARTSVSIPIPVPTGRSMVVVPISFPTIESEKFTPPTRIKLNNSINIDLTSVTNIDAMSRRALKDDMPGIILRGTIRAITKAVVQKKAQESDGVLGLVAAVAAVVTESADERAWRSLPADISIARIQLPAGKHTVEISGKNLDIEVNGRYQVFPIRLVGSSAYIAQPTLQKVAPLPVLEAELEAEKIEPKKPSATKATKKTGIIKKKKAIDDKIVQPVVR